MTRRRSGPIGITGAASGLGALLLARLAQRSDLPELVGIDAAPGPGAVAWRTADVRDPVLADRLAGLHTVVHLATTYDVRVPPEERHALNTRGTGAVLTAAHQAGVTRVVLTTSAAVYDCRPGARLPLGDGTPLRADGDDGLLGDHLEVERLAAHAVRRGLAVTVLRPATLVAGSLGAAYDAALLRQLAAPRLLAVRGVEPQWQLCHADDLVSALELAARGTVTGAAAVACAGSLSQAEVERRAGRRRLELPASVVTGTAERLHRLGLTSASPHELDHLLAPLVVSADRLRGVGWVPAWTNEAALAAYLAEPAAGGDGRSGAYTAAGATVALLGTAALVRRARRRRSR